MSPVHLVPALQLVQSLKQLHALLPDLLGLQLQLLEHGGLIFTLEQVPLPL